MTDITGGVFASRNVFNSYGMQTKSKKTNSKL